MSALAPAIGGTASGPLPSAEWQNGTGSGAAWYGTVAVSPLSYTGSWKAQNNSSTSKASTAITSTAAGTYAGPADGVEYTVTVSSGATSTSTPFTYASTDPATGGGNLSGSGTATNGSASNVADGITITFDSGVTYASGDTYTVLAGTQSGSALSVDTGVGATITSSGGATNPPSYTSNATAIPAGTTVGTIDTGGAVEVLAAPAGNQTGSSGYFTAAPGVTFSADTNSWAKTYSGSLQYTIQTSP